MFLIVAYFLLPLADHCSKDMKMKFYRTYSLTQTEDMFAAEIQSFDILEQQLTRD